MPPLHRRVLGDPPFDHALRWRGDAPGDLPLVRIAHFGDCGWREMDRSHGVHTPPGYPRVIERRLREKGLALQFSSVAVHRFEDLPHHDPTYHLKLTGDPDLVLVQIGALYRRLVVFADTPRNLEIRSSVGLRLGRAVFAAYRVLNPLVRVFGRWAVSYADASELERFLGILRERWPEARLALLTPYPARVGLARRQYDIERRVDADLRAAAANTGAELVEFSRVLPRDALELRAANGYNLNERGSALVGDQLAAYVLEAVSLRARA